MLHSYCEIDKTTYLLLWFHGDMRLFESTLVCIVPSRSAFADFFHKIFQANLKSFLQVIINLKKEQTLVSPVQEDSDVGY